MSPLHHLSSSSSSSDLPESLWWTQNHHHHHQHPRNSFMDDTCSPPSNPLEFLEVTHFPTFLHHHHSTTTLHFNLNRDLELDEDMDDQAMDNHSDNIPINACNRVIMGEENAMVSELDKELLFEKPLTPSDVGKLNRLVIPKQHAEKYFPLSSDSGDKGLLLSFEDESGKYWRFRYSYWSSSQSYVLTKGWSRYVKEKRLDAGDVVFFERHRINGDRIFIGWRRRSSTNNAAAGQESSTAAAVQPMGGGDGWTRALYADRHHQQQHYGHFPNPTRHEDGPGMSQQPELCSHAGSSVHGSKSERGGSSKRLLRLFGVNMECQSEESEPSSTSDETSSLHHHRRHHLHHHMDITTLSHDQMMRNRRG